MSNLVELKDLKDKEFWKMVGIFVALAIGVVGILAVAWWLVVEKMMHP